MLRLSACAVIVSAAFATAATAAEMPGSTLKAPSISSGFSTGLLPAADNANVKLIEVAKRRRRGRRHHRRRHKRNRGAGIAAGIILFGLTAAAIAEERRHERRCRKWLRRCDRGNRRACWKFDDRC